MIIGNVVIDIKFKYLIYLDFAGFVEFLSEIYSGREFYIAGELRLFIEKNLFIDAKLIKDTLDKLVEEQVIRKVDKISRVNRRYSVYVIPNNLRDYLTVLSLASIVYLI